MEEAAAYEHSSRFQRKIDEAKGLREFDTRGMACIQFLEREVLSPGNSILDLGSAAGAALRHVKSILTDMGGYGRMVGVDIVPGWIKAGKQIFQDIEFYLSDITEFRGIEYKFDVIMLNDVVEHVQTSRLGCLMETLAIFSKQNTAVYMHVPSPETQLVETGQYYENVVPPHVLILSMSQIQYQLVHLSYDNFTSCGSHQVDFLSNKIYQCVVHSTPKYYHALFVRKQNSKVFQYTS